MKIRILAVSLALAVAPTLSLAAGCIHDKQALSCATGTVYDAATGTCIVDATT
jgi:hypothetical protein